MTGIFTLGVLGLSLSVDAFAAAVGKGASAKHARWNDALRIGAVFGFLRLLPLLWAGYLGWPSAHGLLQWTIG